MEVAHVRVDVVVRVRRGCVQRALVGNALHSGEVRLEQLVRLRADPARDLGVGGPSVGRVVLEATVGRRIV
jgi:hypothetical protein